MGRNCGLASDERGFMMAALLVTLSVMAVTMSVLVPVWNTVARREREEELVFRGEQYARAIMLFQRKYANARPPSVEVLLNERFLRKKYRDPIANDDFQLLGAGVGTAQPGLGGLGQAGQGQGGQGTGGRGAATPGQPQTGLGSAQPGVGQTAGAGAGLQAAQAAQAAGAQGGPGLVGVVSKSKDQSLRLYKGQQRYSDWVFMPVQMSTQAGTGAAGAGVPGLRGAGAGAPGTRGNPQRGQPNGGPGGLGGSGRQQGPRSGQPFGGAPGVPQPQGGRTGPGQFGQ